MRCILTYISCYRSNSFIYSSTSNNKLNEVGKSPLILSYSKMILPIPIPKSSYICLWQQQEPNPQTILSNYSNYSHKYTDDWPTNTTTNSGFYGSFAGLKTWNICSNEGFQFEDRGLHCRVSNQQQNGKMHFTISYNLLFSNNSFDKSFLS